MIILYLYLAVTVGILLNAYLVETKLIDEKMKSYDEGWNDGYNLGVMEDPNDDPYREYVNEEVGILKG